MDTVGREALCKYVLRPPIAQERVTRGPDGLVRITLKRPFADGTVAVDMDPLSRLSRLATAVPPPRLHTVRYAGVLAPASRMRPKVVPRPAVATEGAAEAEKPAKRAGSRYRPWAELLKRCFAIDVLACPRCGGRMRLVALVHRGGVGAPLPPRRRRVDRRSCSGPSARTAVLEEACAPTCSGRGVGRVAERYRARGADGVEGSAVGRTPRDGGRTEASVRRKRCLFRLRAHRLSLDPGGGACKSGMRQVESSFALALRETRELGRAAGVLAREAARWACPTPRAAPAGSFATARTARGTPRNRRRRRASPRSRVPTGCSRST
jgi:hypothetical protein